MKIYNFFKTFNIKSIKSEKKSQGKISELFNKFKDEQSQEAFFKQIKFNIENEEKEEKTVKIRETFIKHFLKREIILLYIPLIILIFLVLSIEIAIISLLIILMIYIFILYYPKIKQRKEYDDLNHELPYALRHMGTELKSGKGLHDSLITISKANYGSLSKEFKRVLEEVKYGENTENALLSMNDRVKSEGLQRAVHQIIGTLRIGGNLANSLNTIAEDISFDMQIKLKEYSQKLNGFILIYTFIAILAPVISLIMLMAGSTVMGDIIPSDLVLIIYLLFFPMIVIFMGVFIKRLEPRI